MKQPLFENEFSNRYRGREILESGWSCTSKKLLEVIT